MGLFRKYCMGSKGVDFQLVSDPRNTLSNGVFGVANFQDPNLNVAIPVFAIHGNHDDPVGEHGVSAMNLLSASGLINYFGRSPSNDNISINPLLLQKGSTKLALYGLGHIRDERLHRCFAHKKVKFMRPVEDANSWFNLFVLHQNRGVKGHTKKNGIKEEMLNGFLDLVIWAHEHETLIDPVPAVGGKYDIIQPGSSVMASAGADEANEKKVALIEVEGTSYKVTPLPLRSIRPVETATYVLSEEESLPKTAEDIGEYLSERVEELIARAQLKVSHIPDCYLQQNQDLRVPIVRVRVDYSPDYPIINPVLFGGKFMNRVANPHHLLVAMKRRRTAVKEEGGDDLMADGAQGASAQPTLAYLGQTGSMAEMIATSIRDIIAEGKAFGMVSEHPLTNALIDFVDKSEGNAMNSFVQDYLLRAQKGMWRESRAKSDLTHDYLKKLAQQIRENVDREWQQRQAEGGGPEGGGRAAVQPTANPVHAPAVKLEEEAGDMPAEPTSLFRRGTPDEEELSSLHSSHDAIGPLPTPTRAKGGKKAAAKKASAKPAKRGRAAASSQQSPSPLAGLRVPKEEVVSDDDDDDGGGDSDVPPPKRPKAAPKKASRKAAAKAAALPPPAPKPAAKSSTSSVMAAWGKKKKS
eukprot:TRINITY_DN18329_c0_g1_i1.p1 TRINITY_DN18329_c0_g1~~TRINITY_DN18329_c0_g1_i1.p1  ORF type:complete len:729 (+),score=300.85 TRINITY_DN18329_c0_g1_i1:277-2187(+)